MCSSSEIHTLEAELREAHAARLAAEALTNPAPCCGLTDAQFWQTRAQALEAVLGVLVEAALFTVTDLIEFVRWVGVRGTTDEQRRIHTIYIRLMEQARAAQELLDPKGATDGAR